MKEYIKARVLQYPLMQAADVIKMVYQITFGAEHLLTDLKMAKEYFDTEFDNTPITEEPVMEVLSPDIARINFGGFKKNHGSKTKLWDVFVKSATNKRGTNEEFIANLSETLAVLEEKTEAERFQEMKQAIDEYLEGGIHPVHHSAIYHEHYHPHYRVVLLKEAKRILNEYLGGSNE